MNDDAIISRPRRLFSRFADNHRRNADNKKICILRQ